MKNGLDEQYIDLLKDILENGVEKNTRNGKVLSVFGRSIRYKFKDGKFPLLTTKKMYTKGIITELLWFLRGDTNIKFLVDNDCHIWDGDAYKNYEKQIPFQKVIGNDSDSLKSSMIWKQKIDYSSGYPIFERFTQEEFINKIKTDDEFAKKWGELGPVYGKQWRNWNGKPEQVTNYGGGEINPYFCDCQERFEDGNSKVRKKNKGIDQIANLINDLKTNPDSRRLMVNAWNVGELDQMTLPPCHYGFQVYTRELSIDERIDLALNQGYDIIDLDISNSKNPLCDYNIPTRAISLMWNQRSVDTFLGLPFNIASYGLLLEIIAKAVNMVPDQLIGNLGDTHLYLNHIEQAKEQIGSELRIDERVCMCYENPKLDLTRIQEGMSDDEFKSVCDEFNIPTRTRVPFELPTLNINTEFWPYEGGECGVGPIDAMSVIKSFSDDNFCRCLLEEDIQLSNYQSHPTIKAPLSN